MTTPEPDPWPSSSTIQEAISRIQNKTSPIEILYTTAPLPLPDSKALHVSVLDASFNPPTRAHSALALSQRECDMTILLLSVSNADKKLGTNDASYVQRLEMMLRLAASLVLSGKEVGVMVINEPIFVKKQGVLERFLRLDGERGEMEITWLVGYDTLERLFSKKYYGGDEIVMMDSLRAWLRPPDPENSRQGGAKIVCAHRNSKDEVKGVEEFVRSGRLEFVSIGTWEEGLSSTVVRQRIREGGEGWKEMCVDDVVEYIEDVGLYRDD